MPRLIRLTCVVLLTFAPLGISAVHAADVAVDTTIPVSTELPTYNYDLENEPSACLNSNPRPNCGKKAVLSGDRGGWMQYTVFLVMLAGVAIIGTVLVRNVMRRDKAIAEQIKRDES